MELHNRKIKCVDLFFVLFRIRPKRDPGCSGKMSTVVIGKNSKASNTSADRALRRMRHRERESEMVEGRGRESEIEGGRGRERDM